MSALRLKYFDYEHLPVKLQEISRPFKELVELMLQLDNVDKDEIEMGVRKLLEAKDCFVRANLQRVGK